MSPPPTMAFALPWAALIVVWAARARDTAATVARESRASRLAYASLWALAGALLFASAPRLTLRLWPTPAWLGWTALALATAGIGFSIWARLHLGRYWSGTVTLKQGHRIVQSGPYAVVRHPIYTGMLAALAGVAVARGDAQGLAGLALAGLALGWKLRIEERLLEGHFGDEYRDYRHHVRAIIPGIL